MVKTGHFVLTFQKLILMVLFLIRQTTLNTQVEEPTGPHRQVHNANKSIKKNLDHSHLGECPPVNKIIRIICVKNNRVWVQHRQSSSCWTVRMEIYLCLLFFKRCIHWSIMQNKLHPDPVAKVLTDISKARNEPPIFSAYYSKCCSVEEDTHPLFSLLAPTAGFRQALVGQWRKTASLEPATAVSRWAEEARQTMTGSTEQSAFHGIMQWTAQEEFKWYKRH